MDTTLEYPIAEFRAELFEPFLNGSIQFLRPVPPGAVSPAVNLTLMEVREAGHPGVPGQRRPFSLLFALRDSAPLEDRFLHRLAHPGFERCDLLLSRVTVPEHDRRDGTMFYEIVFG